MTAPVYLDNAATTPMSEAVIKRMTTEMVTNFGNASSTHQFGRAARKVLSASRLLIAESIHANEEEIIFTSGGTESDNTAIIQTAMGRQQLGKHIISTQVEHQAVLKSLAYLENQGFEVTYLPVDENGSIDLDAFKAALRPDTILVSIMYGNNEVGTIMPIHEIGMVLQNHQAWFHTDAVQAYGLVDIDVKADHIDLLSVSAHKINGPKFMGFLYEGADVHFPSYLKGGEQEQKRRAGTENIPAIAGFATAVNALTSKEKEQRRDKYNDFKQQIIKQLTAAGLIFEVNGGELAATLPHVLNLWIKGVPTDLMQMNLDIDGFAISGGSACTAGNIDPSHVLVAMYGADSSRIAESIRISFGVFTTSEDIKNFCLALIKISKRLLVTK